MMQEAGIKTVGIDPTEKLLRQARRRDPNGDYRLGRAEALEFPDHSFDLVVSYLTRPWKNASCGVRARRVLGREGRDAG
jgi:ubiquinone/menaquinone biosynthesis C-methylase UbiE